MSKHTVVVGMLLAAGADLNVHGESGYGPVHLAVWLAKPEMCDILLEYAAPIDDPSPRTGETPLQLAARTGRRDQMQYLIAKGANIEARDKDGLTPLHYAAGVGDIEAVKLLLAAGASPLAQNSDGFTPDQMATAEGFKECANCLRDIRHSSIIDTHGRGESVHDGNLLDAMLAQDVEWVKQLLAQSVDVNCPFRKGGLRPLHLAATKSSPAIVETLLKSGANVNAMAEDKDCTALYLACWNRRTEIVEILLRYGADPDVGTRNGLTPLALAAGLGDILTARMLIGAGANANAPCGKRGYTALHAAAKAGSAEMAELLIRSGANVAARDEEYGSPMDIAVSRGDREIISVLKKYSVAAVAPVPPESSISGASTQKRDEE